MSKAEKLEKNLNRLVARQQSLFNRVQLIFDLATALDNQIDPDRLKTFQIRSIRLPEVKLEFQNIVQQIVEVKQELNPDELPNYASLDSFDDLCEFIEYVAQKIIPQPQSDIPQPQSTESKPRMINMPKINLVKFSGEDVSLWPLFYENFKSLIHQNIDLSAAEKLQYLLGSLEGKALKCCNSVDAIPDNYEIIWNLLVQNYQNKRYLASSYFEKILNLRPIPNDNPANLQSFLEKFDLNVSALKRLQLPNLADFMLVYIALLKLPQNLVNNFELLKNNDEIPQYDELIGFIRHQSKSMVKIEKPRHTQNYNLPSTSKSPKTFVANENVRRNCVACKKDPHLLIQCQIFKKFSPDKRFQIVKENNLCLNCFSSKHHLSSCDSKYACRECRQKHHSLLHRSPPKAFDNSKTQLVSNDPVPRTSKDLTHSLCTTNSETPLNNRNNLVLLSTVIVKVNDRWNREQSLRFLLDSGSVSNLITLNCCKRLGLQTSRYFSNVTGIGGVTSPIKGKTQFVIKSSINHDYSIPIDALVVEKVTNCLPDMPVDTQKLDYLESLPLADPTYHTPGIIDGVLSASVFVQILGSGRVVGPPGTPTALQTSLGFVIVGNAPILENKNMHSYFSFLTLESLVEKMWNLEDLSPPIVGMDDEICEKLFVENFKREPSGRYIVALPFREDPSLLGDSYSLALRRFQSLEKRFERSPQLKQLYSQSIRDYLDQNHMILVPNDTTVKPNYYIPHHCIFKPNSSSTPCRVVFDSSAKTLSKSNKLLSLNDILYTGPKLQNHIFTILINFRLFPIAMTADLKNMFRQIKIIEEHHKFQRILWRFEPTQPIATYELTRVSFGVRSSPYLSLRTIKQLLTDETKNYPLAVSYADRDMYVDDLVCSVPTIEEAKILQPQLVELFAAGGFPLVKWSSNSLELLSQIPSEITLNKSVTFDDSLPILGLQWNPYSDDFVFKINSQLLPCTKRNILSCVARIFDPLGFLAPVILQMKLLIKELWNLKCDWDDPTPTEVENVWLNIISEFEVLNNLKIHRPILCSEPNRCKILLIGFCDASQMALGAAVFVRVENPDGQIDTSLLCAQSKVAPMQSTTLPRLELNAAVLLSKLLTHICDTYSLRTEISNIYALSDSMITLAWIHSNPKRWPVYISNRISKIQQNLSSRYWHFVPGKLNSADCISRGLSPRSLINSNSWFSGPSWLHDNPEHWPIKSFDDYEIVTPECENLVFTVKPSILSPLYTIINYFSSWSKMLNSTVYVLRFIKILPKSPNIRASDLNMAELYLLRAVQQNHFASEFNALSKNISVSNKILKLNPFLQDGIIRVGGRLSNASLSYDVQHPIVLPKTDPLINCLIDYTHRINCHTGPHLTLALLRQKYWILSARDTVRRRIWACNHCFRSRPKSIMPHMADLPAPRVNQNKAFLHTGVDYTGAFLITLSKHRGIKSQKAYVCLFICLATKAIHLELASSLSTEAFISAFKRFVSRRGSCAVLYSDNATNFVSAKTQFDEAYSLLKSQEFKDKFQQELNIHRIEWKFNPPTASHFGGIWEANIKSVKVHLTRVIGSQILTFEEFTTVLAQIEALLNSRPLCCLSDDPAEPVALTPAHFLYGSPLNCLPSENVSDIPVPRLTRFKLLDFLVQSYWKRWHIEYLTTLQMRQKWNLPNNPIKRGTICVIIQNNIPPLQWPLAIVTELYPGKDGITRVALVKTKHAQYVRPVAKLCPLPNQ